MRVRRAVAGMAAASMMLGGVALATAPAASAAEIQVPVNCVTGDLTDNSELAAHPGDTLVLVGEACDWPNTNPNFAWLFESYPLTLDAPHRWVVGSRTPAGTYGGPTGNDFTMYVINGSGWVCGGEAYPCGSAFFLRLVVDPPPIPDWVQAYGRGSADDACIDQWHPSWNQWANDGTGGYVCTRTIPQYGR